MNLLSMFSVMTLIGSIAALNQDMLNDVDLLGFGNPTGKRTKRLTPLRNSAPKFLLELYEELNEQDAEDKYSKNRHKRALKRQQSGENFLTAQDLMEIEKCNNIITFASKTPSAKVNDTNEAGGDILLQFNTKDVPKDLQLVQATLRFYQNRSMSQNQQGNRDTDQVAISVYHKIPYTQTFRIFSTVNSTTQHKGWLECDITAVLSKWLQRSSMGYGNEILLSVANSNGSTLHAAVVGVDGALNAGKAIEYQPFIVSYFHGPMLQAKIQKLRFKREIVKRKALIPADVYHMPKSCERLNFTLDFKDLQMHNWVIAPKKFEAFICSGDCNFPLNAHMNATNHAIVQTLMQLKKPSLPKPCCVPTVLSSISILRYINEDSVNLSRYPQSVARECGCH